MVLCSLQYIQLKSSEPSNILTDWIIGRPLKFCKWHRDVMLNPVYSNAAQVEGRAGREKGQQYLHTMSSIQQCHQVRLAMSLHTSKYQLASSASLNQEVASEILNKTELSQWINHFLTSNGVFYHKRLTCLQKCKIGKTHVQIRFKTRHLVEARRAIRRLQLRGLQLSRIKEFATPSN